MKSNLNPAQISFFVTDPRGGTQPNQYNTTTLEHVVIVFWCTKTKMQLDDESGGFGSSLSRRSFIYVSNPCRLSHNEFEEFIYLLDISSHPYVSFMHFYLTLRLPHREALVGWLQGKFSSLTSGETVSCRQAGIVPVLTLTLWMTQALQSKLIHPFFPPIRYRAAVYTSYRTRTLDQEVTNKPVQHPGVCP